MLKTLEKLGEMNKILLKVAKISQNKNQKGYQWFKNSPLKKIAGPSEFTGRVDEMFNKGNSKLKTSK